jgi:hypothetical protein
MSTHIDPAAIPKSRRGFDLAHESVSECYGTPSTVIFFTDVSGEQGIA